MYITIEPHCVLKYYPFILRHLVIGIRNLFVDEYWRVSNRACRLLTWSLFYQLKNACVKLLLLILRLCIWLHTHIRINNLRTHAMCRPLPCNNKSAFSISVFFLFSFLYLFLSPSVALLIMQLQFYVSDPIVPSIIRRTNKSTAKQLLQRILWSFRL